MGGNHGRVSRGGAVTEGGIQAAELVARLWLSTSRGSHRRPPRAQGTELMAPAAPSLAAGSAERGRETRPHPVQWRFKHPPPQGPGAGDPAKTRTRESRMEDRNSFFRRLAQRCSLAPPCLRTTSLGKLHPAQRPPDDVAAQRLGRSSRRPGSQLGARCVLEDSFA